MRRAPKRPKAHTAEMDLFARLGLRMGQRVSEWRAPLLVHP